MAFRPLDPMDMGPGLVRSYPTRFTGTRELDYCTEKLYDRLRRDMVEEMYRMHRSLAAANTTPGRNHAGQKVEAKHIESLQKSPARQLQSRMPDSVTAMTGYRAWRASLTKDGWRLRALGQETIWEPKKKFEARCERSSVGMSYRSTPAGVVGEPCVVPTHPSPDFECECGVWAFSHPDKLLTALENYSPSVLGKVSLWGRVIECENGFRAQYAYPTELWLLDPKLQELSWVYGVPVRMEE